MTTGYSISGLRNLKLVAAMAAAVVAVLAIAFAGSAGVANADTTGPAIVRVERLNLPAADKSYSVGENIQVGVVFDEPVSVVGSPELSITIGRTTHTAEYRETYRNETSLKFEFSVKDSDLKDWDGYSVAANSLSVSKAAIVDNFGNAATLTHAELPDNARWRVNFTGPSISHINIGSSGGADNVYHAGETIRFFVYYTEDIITGADTGVYPELRINVGTATRKAIHYSTNLSEITFVYTVTTADNDADGISIPANPIDLTDGGWIKDSDNIPAAPNFAGYGNNPLHKVQGTDTTAPTIVRIDITSDPGEDKAYQYNDVIQIGVVFSENITAGPNSSIRIEFDDTYTWAAFSHVSGAAAYYTYTVHPLDIDEDGLSIIANALRANNRRSGTAITDIAGNVAVVTHAAVADDPDHLVQGTDTIAPVIESISITSTGTNNIYSVGDTVTFAVRFNEDIDVNTTLTLSFMVNNTAHTADYNTDPSSDNSVMTFDYTVEAGDQGPITGIPANSVSATDGTLIFDGGGNVADLTHAAEFFEAQTVHILFGVGGV